MSRSMPWVAIPLLWVLCSDARLFPAIDLDLTVLFLPMAALLADRYRMAGLYAVIIGGLPLPIGLQFGNLGFPADGAIYAASVWLSVLVARGRPASEWMTAQRASPAYIAAFLLLPFSVAWPVVELDNDVHLRLHINLLPLFYFFVFLLGLSATASRLAVVSILITGAFGIGLETVGLSIPLSAPPELDEPIMSVVKSRYVEIHHLDHPLEIATALLAFAVARHIRRVLSDESTGVEQVRGGRLLVFGALALWTAHQAFDLPGQLWSPTIQQRSILDDNYAIALACLVAGFRYRALGVALAYGWWALILVAANAILADFDLENVRLWLRVATPFAIIAFALMGVVARDRRDGIRTMPPVGSWTVYVLLLCALLPTFFDLSTLAGVIGLLGAFALAILIGALGQQLWRWAARLRLLTPVRALLGAVALVLLAGTILSNLQTVIEMVGVVGTAVLEIGAAVRDSRRWELDPTFYALVVLLFYLVIFLSALAELLKAIPALRSDGPKLMRAIRQLREGGLAAISMSVGPSPGAASGTAVGREPRDVTIWERSARIVAALRTICAGLFVLSVAAILIYAYRYY